MITKATKNINQSRLKLIEPMTDQEHLFGNTKNN